jgi:hypothetical protein
MCRVNSYKDNYRQRSVDTGNYNMDKHNIKSQTITGKHWRKKHINTEK